jgi:hypothetical protein
MGRELRSEKQVRGAESRRRVAVYLQQLVWLEGFPVADGWHRLDTGERVTVDGALIARTRRAARTVMREHPGALADAVGDVDRWWAIVDAKLAWCSAPRGVLDLLDHAPRRIASQARALAARPGLGAAAIAAGVAWALRPHQLGDAIAWLAGQGALIDDVVTTLALARLAEQSAAGVAAWIALAAVDAPDPKTAVEGVASVDHRLRGTRETAITPGPRSGHHVRAWLATLCRCAPEVQQRALAVLAVAGVDAALAPWCRWERANADRLARAAAFAGRAFDRKEEARNLERITGVVNQVKASAPRAIAVPDVLREIDVLASGALAGFHAAIVRLLAAIPAGEPGVRTAMLLHVARIAATSDHARAAWLWDALAAALAAGASPRLLDPWRAILAAGGRAYFDDALIDALPRRAEVNRLVDALAGLAALGPVSRVDAERTAAWIAAGLADELARDVVIGLRDVDFSFEVGVVRAIRALSDGTAGDLIAQAPIVLGAFEELDYHERQELVALIEHAAGGGAVWLVRAAFAANQGKVLADAAGLLPVLPRARWPAVATARRPAWIGRYPAALAAALGHLAAVDPDAERTAARRLATDLPDPEALRREIAALRARVPLAAGQAKRLATLERRLVAPGSPSPARLARLAGKLERTAVSVGLLRFTAQVTATAALRLQRTFPGGGWPEPLDRRTREIVFGLLRLDAADRALAGRLLRARTGPRPWDLRDDPVNVAFLATMRDAGLDPAAWLDDAPVTVVTPDGRPLELALCSDPLEVFAMGAHFETCLSPGGGNFFSVLANAADLNKRVLYARRGDRVVGRCLLAVTDSFAILTFNPYCHERAVDFAAIARTFALELAARMRTRVAPYGAVRLLVARDWYDDGPRDLVGRFGGLDEAALDLANADPGVVVERLRGALGHELDDVTLPMVLALPSLRARPALVAPLARYLLAARSTATHITAAELALEAGDPELADRLLGEHGDAIRLEDHAWPGGKLLALLRPSRALVRLRATRARGVRSWPDDRGDRIAVAGLAMEALHRPRKAAELYRLALDRDPYLEYDLNDRLAAVAASIEA